MHKSDARLEPIASLSEAVRRRARNRLLDLGQQSSKQNQALARQLRALKLEYRRNLSTLMGSGAMRRYKELRKQLAKAPRSQRIRESRALLDEIGFDRVRAARLRKRYLDAARKLLRFGSSSGRRGGIRTSSALRTIWESLPSGRHEARCT